MAELSGSIVLPTFLMKSSSILMLLKLPAAAPDSEMVSGSRGWCCYPRHSDLAVRTLRFPTDLKGLSL